jgi:hypothetical protein
MFCYFHYFDQLVQRITELIHEASVEIENPVVNLGSRSFILRHPVGLILTPSTTATKYGQTSYLDVGISKIAVFGGTIF